MDNIPAYHVRLAFPRALTTLISNDDSPRGCVFVKPQFYSGIVMPKRIEL